MPQTWDKEPNLMYAVEELAEDINHEKEIEGITVLGGEPFEQADNLAEFLSRLNNDLSVVIFTGYRLDELKRSNDENISKILQSIDVLVDGEYIASQRDLSRPMVGSSNQKFHFLTDRYGMDDFPARKLEVRLQKNGSVLINGNGEISRIKVE